MALGNLADLEELEPTPGRPDPLTLYHKVGTSQEGTEGGPNSGWGPILFGDWGGQVRREELDVYRGVSPIRVSFSFCLACIEGTEGCLRGVLCSPAWEGWGLNFSAACYCPRV